MKKRVGVAVWVNHLRSVRHLKRFGNIHFVSKRYKYVVMYVDFDELETTIDQLSRLHFVTKVERSYRDELPTEFSNVKGKRNEEFEYQVEI